MGKRLDQQPMYPQYTYYYPHYLQTKGILWQEGIRDLFQLHATSTPPFSCHQPLLESVFLESARSSRLSSPCTYPPRSLLSLTFLFSEFTAFPAFGHLAPQKASKEAFQLRRCLTGLLWLVVLRLCLVPGVKPGSGVRSNSSTTH